MRRSSMEEPIFMSMLLGLTGSGKSASGNTIIGVRETFKEDLSPVAVTRTCESAQKEVDGQTITVIDTVGLSDTSVKITDAQTEIERMLQDINLDVFLLVIKLSETFTEKDSKVVKWIQDNFGAKALKHTIVLFTHADQLQGPVERYLSESETLRSVVDQCSGRYHVFNNKDEDRSQVTELLTNIESLRINNRYKRYTEQDYKETQKDLLHKKCVAGAAVGGVGTAGVAALAAVGGVAVLGAGGAAGAASGGVGGAVASAIGAAALTAGQAAIIGATGGAVIGAVAAGAGVYFLARKYIPKEKDKSN